MRVQLLIQLQRPERRLWHTRALLVRLCQTELGSASFCGVVLRGLQEPHCSFRWLRTCCVFGSQPVCKLELCTTITRLGTTPYVFELQTGGFGADCGGSEEDQAPFADIHEPPPATESR